jgi:DNA-binding MarR family transcriptional regulator
MVAYWCVQNGEVVPDEDTASVLEPVVGPTQHPPRATEAIRSLEALSASVSRANEFALNRLQMRSLDALALRQISLGARNESPISPKTLNATLRISSAAVTKLIDRLVERGRVTRQPNPKDRRSIVLVPCPTVEDDLARAYGNIDSPVAAVMGSLTDGELSAVTEFASRLSQALDEETTKRSRFASSTPTL